MYGKIVDGKLIIAGNKIQIANGWITNPSETQLKDNGYKEIVRTEKQGYDDESDKLVETYTDTGKEIEVSYAKVKLSEAEINNVLQSKIDSVLDEVSKIDLLKAVTGDKDAISKIESVLKTVSATESKKK